MKNIQLIILCLVLASCSSITSTSLVGYEALPIKKSIWQGAWLLNNQVIHVKVVDENKGELLLIVIDVNDDEKLVHKMTAFVRKGNKYNYINIPSPDEKPNYVFAQFFMKNNTLYAEPPDYDVVLNAVETKQVKGINPVNEKGGSYVGSIQLTDTSEKITLFLEENSAFKYKENGKIKKNDKEGFYFKKLVKK